MPFKPSSGVRRQACAVLRRLHNMALRSCWRMGHGCLRSTGSAIWNGASGKCYKKNKKTTKQRARTHTASPDTVHFYDVILIYMSNLSCEKCGKPGRHVVAENRLCWKCHERLAIERCATCGEKMIGVMEAILCDNCHCHGVVYSCEGCGRGIMYEPRGAAIGPGGQCYRCYIRDRLSWVSEADREAIRRFASKHHLGLAVDEARRLLGWSMPEAIFAVLILRSTEPIRSISE